MMDRETIVDDYVFEAGVNSPNISAARFAWQGIYLPPTFAGSTISFEVMNEIDGVYYPAKDVEGVELPPVIAVAGDFIPVRQEVSFAKNWRFVSSSAEAAGLAFKVSSKT